MFFLCCMMTMLSFSGLLFFKQKSAYELRISDWSSDVCSSDLGPSGCGKTTLLNVISGLIAPSEGRVRFGGRDVTDLLTRDRNIAQVFQFPVIYDTMTVFENLAFPLRNRGFDARSEQRRVGKEWVSTCRSRCSP